MTSKSADKFPRCACWAEMPKKPKGFCDLPARIPGCALAVWQKCQRSRKAFVTAETEINFAFDFMAEMPKKPKGFCDYLQNRWFCRMTPDGQKCQRSRKAFVTLIFVCLAYAGRLRQKCQRSRKAFVTSPRPRWRTPIHRGRNAKEAERLL